MINYLDFLGQDVEVLIMVLEAKGVSDIFSAIMAARLKEARENCGLENNVKLTSCVVKDYNGPGLQKSPFSFSHFSAKKPEGSLTKFQALFKNGNKTTSIELKFEGRNALSSALAALFANKSPVMA